MALWPYPKLSETAPTASRSVRGCRCGYRRSNSCDAYLMARRLQSLLDGCGRWIGHDIGSRLEVDRVLIEIEMAHHQTVLIVDGNRFSINAGPCNSVACIYPWSGCTGGCLRFDGCDRGPYQSCMARQRGQSAKKNREPGLELQFRIAPPMQSVVEVYNGAGDPLHGCEFGDLAGKTRIPNACG